MIFQLITLICSFLFFGLSLYNFIVNPNYPENIIFGFVWLVVGFGMLIFEFGNSER